MPSASVGVERAANPVEPRRRRAARRGGPRDGWIRPAAARCGIPESVAREWIQRGKGEHPTRRSTREFAAFAADIARAQGEWEARQLAVLDAVAGTDRPTFVTPG